MDVWLERFVLTVLAAAFLSLVILNLMKLDYTQRITLGIAIVAISYFVGHTIYVARSAPVAQSPGSAPIPKETNEPPPGTDALQNRTALTHSTGTDEIAGGKITLPHPTRPSGQKAGESRTSRDRHLSLEQANYIIASISAFGSQPVVLNFVLGDTESQVYAGELAQVLNSAQWNIKRVAALPLTFRGIRVTPQDPTDVPQAVEAILRAFSDQDIAIARDYVQPSSFEYNGNKYVPTLYLLIGKNGKPTPVPPKYVVPLTIPNTPDLPTSLTQLNEAELGNYAEQMANVLRDYEIQNRRRFEAEWHIHGTPLEESSYRGFFEKVLRPRAKALRDEIQRRLNIGPTTVWAIDADALDGLQPLRDAGSYLNELATKLKNSKR
jgi:hypothetical protein